MNTWIKGMLLVCLGMTLAVTSAYAEDTVGTLKSVKGDVSVVRKGASIVATTGMKLLADDKIISGPDSSTGITLQDGTRLSIGAKSVFQLNEFRYNPVKRDGNMLVSLIKGSMRFVTGLLGKQNPASVAIRTPSSTIGIRGTDFIVSVVEGE